MDPSKRLRIIVGLVVLVGVGILAWQERSPALRLFYGRQEAGEIVVSGNIEAHESVLAFVNVTGRIAELPVDEGAAVKAGTVIARVDDADYRQEVVVAQAQLETARREIKAAQSNRAAAGRAVESSQAAQTLARMEYDRASELAAKGIATVEARDQTYAAWQQAVAAQARDMALADVAAKQVDVANGQLTQAADALKLAELVLAQTELTAPVDVVVTVREGHAAGAQRRSVSQHARLTVATAGGRGPVDRWTCTFDPLHGTRSRLIAVNEDPPRSDKRVLGTGRHIGP